ncbi:MAG: DUF2202 domain-containing protein [Acidobacteriota bacterium]
MNRRTMAAVVMIAAMWGTMAAAQGRGAGRQGGCAQLDAIPVGTLTQAEQAGLLFTREEEKLARDVYMALFETWQLPVFAQIAASEQRHMDAVKVLLDRYSIPDPVGANGPGVFTDARLAALYTQLVAKGRVSQAEALQVGATIEDLDIADIVKLIEATQLADLDLVYGNLARGSRNHLRAFVGAITAAGGTYTPQYLGAEDYAAIIAAPMERGAGFGGGQGKGRGKGCGNCQGQGQGNGNGNGSKGNGGGNNGGGNGPGDGSCGL